MVRREASWRGCHDGWARCSKVRRDASSDVLEAPGGWLPAQDGISPPGNLC